MVTINTHFNSKISYHKSRYSANLTTGKKKEEAEKNGKKVHEEKGGLKGEEKHEELLSCYQICKATDFSILQNSIYFNYLLEYIYFIMKKCLKTLTSVNSFQDLLLHTITVLR